VGTVTRLTIETTAFYGVNDQTVGVKDEKVESGHVRGSVSVISRSDPS
jgi:hypothetical protein